MLDTSEAKKMREHISTPLTLPRDKAKSAQPVLVAIPHGARRSATAR